MGTWREKDLCPAFVIKIINSARMLNYIYKMCMVKVRIYKIDKIYENIFYPIVICINGGCYHVYQ